MKKLFIYFTLFIVLFSCKNGMLPDYLEASKNPITKEDSTSNASADYFYKIEQEEELNVQSSLQPPYNVEASKAQFNNKVSITWNAVVKEGYAVTYNVYRRYKKEDGTIAWSRIGEDVKENSFDDTGIPGSAYVPVDGEDPPTPNEVLKENVDYTYSVRAVYKKEETVLASRLSYFSVGYKLSNVYRLEISFRDELDRINLTWFPVKGAKFYKVYRAEPAATDAELDWTKFNTTVSSTKYTDYIDYISDTEFNLSAGEKEYRYKVIPYYNETTPAVFENAIIVRGAMLALGAPATPSMVRVSKGEYGSGIRVEWNPMADVTFKVYRSENIFGPFNQIAGNISGTYYIDPLTSVNAIDKDKTFYYRVSSKNVAADSKLSQFDAERDSGFIFLIPKDRVFVSKRLYPQQIDVTFSFKNPIAGDKIYIQYSADEGVSWVDLDTAGYSTTVTKVVADTIPGYDPVKNYKFRMRSVKSELIDSAVFDAEDNLKGKSNLVQLDADKAGPEMPVLTLSQGDHSRKNKILVSGKWEGMADYGNFAEVDIIRVYYWGKEVDPTKSFEINKKEKIVATNVLIENGEFAFEDDLLPDINPQADTILPMNARILGGSGWTYWTWDREAWKYLNRKIPFDMKKSVGAYYKIVARWKGVSDWPTSASIDLTYGYPAITNDDFAHLSMWMREVCMNRLWHLIYVPYWGTISVTPGLIKAAQNKQGEYSGRVAYVITNTSATGGSGKCTIANYSDWGPDWNLSISADGNSFGITVVWKELATFDMPLKIVTPLFKGDVHASIQVMSGNFVDVPRGGFVEVTQEGQAMQRFDNLGFYNDNIGKGNGNEPNPNGSLIERYFPPVALEFRLNPSADAGPSFELTQINFRENVEFWEGKHSVDWTHYYKFKFK